MTHPISNRIAIRTIAVIAFCLPAFAADWNPRLAAGYLDSRQKEWFAWPRAQAPGGVCISCHTSLTYVLARPALRKALSELQPTTYETGLADSVRQRVDKRESKDILPGVTKEPAASQAVGVEAIFSALILTLDQPGKLSSDAQRAYDRLWSLQLREGKAKGSWAWFSFDTDPYETADSQFFGASLAAFAVGATPAAYRDRPDVKERVADLADYLQREQEAQPLHNRAVLLWAAAGLPGMIPSAAKRAITDELWSKQQPDGGWTVKALGPWKDRPAAPASEGSSAYSTALAALALEKSGVPASDARLQRALAWLKSHQDPATGSWPAQSMNKHREPGSMEGQFMSDAATAFASLALLSTK